MILAAACTSLSPSATVPAPPSAPLASPSASRGSPVPAIDPELGPAPTPAYPDSQAIGIGTMRIAKPRLATARFWLTCEWPTTARVAWLYTGDGSPDKPGGVVTLFGESVTPTVWTVTEGDGQSFGLSREGQVADYWIDPASPPLLVHTPDWSSGTLSFEHLRLDPESWGIGPLPTPAEAFERPLGDDPATVDLGGSFEWACGSRPDTVPTPGPPTTPEPGVEVTLPKASLAVADESRTGIVGCGLSWGTGGHASAGESCGGPGIPVPPFAPTLPEPLPLESTQTLHVGLPPGYHFQAWRYEYVDQPTAELYRGAEPPGFVQAADDRSTTERTLLLDPPPVGDWMIRITYDATNGDIVVNGMPTYFRVVVR